jgi:dienelactone hydrolase
MRSLAARIRHQFSSLGLLCLLVAFAFIVALFWAKNRDPFTRIEFSLKTPQASETKGIVVMPKPSARFPVVVYLYGSGGSLPMCGTVLRQIAELGCAAVAINFDQKDQGHFDRQLLALPQYLGKQSWAQSNAVAWVGFSLGAQRSLSFLLSHPEVQPQLYVRIAGGLVEELGESRVQSPESKVQRQETNAKGQRPNATTSAFSLQPSAFSNHLSHLTCEVLLVHGERDEIFPVADCREVGELFTTNGVRVEIRILPDQPHGFGRNHGDAGQLSVTMRGVAEYCAAHLPKADYGAKFDNGQLSAVEKERFNVAMSRAGQNRRELWKAVKSCREPERRTVMTVIGGLEDYDLAHLSAGHLKELVKVAWQARRTYPWCRDTPLDIFEKFTASPRVFLERLEGSQARFHDKLSHELKYCRTVGQACDTIGRWERQRTAWLTVPGSEDPTPDEVLSNRGGNCKDLISLFICSARSVGVAIRPVTTTWPLLGSGHYWAEIWDVKQKAWHSFDGSSAERPYDYDWVLRVPKAATHAAPGERGAWNASRENRWESYTNTVGLFYPSGMVLVRVLDHDAPKPGQRVNVQVWLKGNIVHLTSAKTDNRGEVHFTLGQSARRPYRFMLDGIDAGDWEWLAVQAGNYYEVTLRTDCAKSFNPEVKPPPLGFPQWDKLPERK